MIKKTWASLVAGEFALDFIAFIAIAFGLIVGKYLVSLVIVIMLTGGNLLERYATKKAQKSLTELANRLPHQTILWQNGSLGATCPIESVAIGTEIAVRKGEVIPLDGILISPAALIDESSLTGEPYPNDKQASNLIRSGTVNLGDTLVIKTTTDHLTSTYAKIIKLVENANANRAPIVRLANRYSALFTGATFAICILAYIISKDINTVLAVLVVATPCPLILATPIALFGGMNKSAKQSIFVKNPASLEQLTKTTDIIFDKTGTLTMGQPNVEHIEIVDLNYSVEKIYSIAEAIEKNSLHPFAKTIVAKACELNAPKLNAVNIRETIGMGITGTINGNDYTLNKTSGDQAGITISTGNQPIAYFIFSDEIKKDFPVIFTKLKTLGLHLHIFTGDKPENIDKLLSNLNSTDNLVSTAGNLKPEDKQAGITKLQAENKTVAMIGDGINDAPALATANVGLVFSNQEQTASSEAADIVFLRGDLQAVLSTIAIARRTISIALQSIWIGIGLSIGAMILAAFGYIPPVTGAIFQEAVDILVIFNALRASV